MISIMQRDQSQLSVEKETKVLQTWGQAYCKGRVFGSWQTSTIISALAH
jgi:hypothetical protein